MKGHAAPWRMKAKWATLTLACVGFAAGCGSDEDLKQPRKNAGGSGGDEGDATSETFTLDREVDPPRDYYDALFERTLRELDAGTYNLDTDPTRVLWVNFDGGRIAEGFGAGQSFLVCNGSASLSSADFGPERRQEVVDRVQAHFDAAGVALDVTQSKPQRKFYTTIHIAGGEDPLGCGHELLGGLAPRDNGNAHPADVGFVFAEHLESAGEVARAVSHQVGHTFGLAHCEDAEGLMSPQAVKSGKKFVSTGSQDAVALLQEAIGKAGQPSLASTTQAAQGLAKVPAQLTNLPGLGQISSIGELLPELDPQQAANLAGVIPELKKTLPAGLAQSVPGNLPGLDRVLTIVGMASQKASGQQNLSGQNLAKLAQQVLNPQTLQTIGGLAGLAIGGTSGAQIGAAIAAVGALLGSGNVPAVPGSGGNNSGSTSAGGQLPKLDQLLGLAQGAQGASVSDLLKNLTGSARVVGANYSGASKQALHSLLKVAYSQAYRRASGDQP